VILRSSVALTLTSRPEPAGSPTLQCHGRRRGGSGAAVRRYRAPLQTTRLRITMRDVEPEVFRVIDVPAAVTLGCGPGRRSSTRRAHTRPGTCLARRRRVSGGEPLMRLDIAQALQDVRGDV